MNIFRLAKQDITAHLQMMVTWEKKMQCSTIRGSCTGVTSGCNASLVCLFLKFQLSTQGEKVTAVNFHAFGGTPSILYQPGVWALEHDI